MTRDRRTPTTDEITPSETDVVHVFEEDLAIIVPPTTDRQRL
jgi:hypothetical protein